MLIKYFLSDLWKVWKARGNKVTTQINILIFEFMVKIETEQKPSMNKTVVFITSHR